MGNLRRRLARDGVDYRDAVLSGAGGYNHGEVSDFEFRVNTACHNVEFLVSQRSWIMLSHGVRSFFYPIISDVFHRPTLPIVVWHKVEVSVTTS